MKTLLAQLLQIDEARIKALENVQMISVICQLAIALWILKVWVIRYDTITEDFKSFKFPDWMRTAVGITKAILCIFLLSGIWINQFAIASSISMGILMIGAIFAHYRASHSFSKTLEAIIVFVLCMIVAVLCWKYKFQAYY